MKESLPNNTMERSSKVKPLQNFNPIDLKDASFLGTVKSEPYTKPAKEDLLEKNETAEQNAANTDVKPIKKPVLQKAKTLLVENTDLFSFLENSEESKAQESKMIPLEIFRSGSTDQVRRSVINELAEEELIMQTRKMAQHNRDALDSFAMLQEQVTNTENQRRYSFDDRNPGSATQASSLRKTRGSLASIDFERSKSMKERNNPGTLELASQGSLTENLRVRKSISTPSTKTRDLHSGDSSDPVPEKSDLNLHKSNLITNATESNQIDVVIPSKDKLLLNQKQEEHVDENGSLKREASIGRKSKAQGVFNADPNLSPGKPEMKKKISKVQMNREQPVKPEDIHKRLKEIKAEIELNIVTIGIFETIKDLGKYIRSETENVNSNKPASIVFVFLPHYSGKKSNDFEFE